MKPVCTIALLVLLCLSGLTVEQASAIQLSKPAPDFTLNDLNGNRTSLSSYRGKAVLLNFWSTTCAPCVAEVPSLNTLSRELKASGLVVLGIALDRTAAPVRELADRMHISYPLLLDSQQDVYFDSYALFGQPVSLLIDRQGVVRDKLVGQIDWSSPPIRAKILNLLKGK